jgi:hypothetical protein
MTPRETEQERWMRIRQERLAARDPLKKERKTQRRIAEMHRKSQKRLSFLLMLQDIPHRVKGAFFGVIIGGIIGALMPIFSSKDWADFIWMATVPVVGIFGYFYGQALDARETIKDVFRRY